MRIRAKVYYYSFNRNGIAYEFRVLFKGAVNTLQTANLFGRGGSGELLAVVDELGERADLLVVRLGERIMLCAPVVGVGAQEVAHNIPEPVEPNVSDR